VWVLETFLDVDFGGEMDTRVWVVLEELVDVFLTTDITTYDVEVVVIIECCDVPSRTVREVVESVHGVTSIEQFGHDPSADESRCTRNRDCVTHW
jgi:hypothetical protein